MDFLRLWIVVALAWAGVVYLYAQPGRDIYSEAIVDLPQGPGIVVPLDISDAGVRKAIVDYHSSDTPTNSERASLIERDIDLVEKEIDETRSRNTSKQHYQWQQFALVKFRRAGHPFLFGTVAAWVISGFRPTTTQP